ncbi:PQQ-binding-like beta-propeller repeat protein [Candidatus Bathyarchaeota archaeon]|nr:PQQ-binding-like beta-propeller repeat protein [Candidatus Bathyarchaeota archaeon]
MGTFVTAQNQDTEYPWPMFLHDLEHTSYTDSPVPRIPTVLWNYTMGGTSWGPVVAYGKVFLGSADKKVYALDQMTGAKIWEFATGNAIWVSPAVANGKVFIGSTDGKVYALDQSNGAKIWEFNIGAGAVLPSTVADGMVIVPSGDGKIYALHQSNGSKVWDITIGGSGEPGTYPAIADGKIYIVFGNTLYAIISRSTLTISLSETRTNVGSTIIVNGRLSPARLNASITVQRRREGETTWGTLALVLTNATGHYSYSWVPDTAGSFELRSIWEGNAYALASQSSTQTITVELSPSTLTMSVSQTRTNIGSTVTIEGNLSPARSGASIIIQWRRGGETTWSTLTTVTTDAAGHYTYAWRPDAEGSFELRAYWQGDASTLAGQSDAQLITVEPSPPLITTELLIAIIAVAGVAAAAILYIMRRPKKPKPSGLRLTANPKEIFADGESTSNITVELVDAQGNQIPAERDTSVSFNATDGRIVGSITIPKGRSSATVILTSSTKIGTISVKASARGLMDARTEVIFKEKKRYCMYCGRRMPLEAKICPSCGNAPPSGVDTKICKNCGTIIPEVARFCRECGASQTQ